MRGSSLLTKAANDDDVGVSMVRTPHSCSLTADGALLHVRRLFPEKKETSKNILYCYHPHDVTLAIKDRVLSTFTFVYCEQYTRTECFISHQQVLPLFVARLMMFAPPAAKELPMSYFSPYKSFSCSSRSW